MTELHNTWNVGWSTGPPASTFWTSASEARDADVMYEGMMGDIDKEVCSLDVLNAEFMQSYSQFY